ncbi:hypothetical protein LP418_20010 [Nocardioides sp. B-3]|nr:hypothetical protein [Nocardioides sp. B-3]UUZ58445.1 hypothetical protein LP418_20010 [Nocardioides sp. B-3]
MSLSIVPCSAVTPSGEWDEAIVGKRYAHVLRLCAVDEVAEDPADSTERLAVRGKARQTVVAGHALADARDDDPVADLDPGAARADLGDDADPFVAEDSALLHCGNVPLENVQIGTADGGALDLDYRVRRFHDHRLRDFIP